MGFYARLTIQLNSLIVYPKLKLLAVLRGLPPGFKICLRWGEVSFSSVQNGYPAGVDNYNINDVLNRQQNKPKNPTTTVPKKKTILVLPHLGVQSKIVTKQLKTCINKFDGCIDLRVIFQSARRIKSFFPYKDVINRSHCQKLYVMLVVGTARISTLEKRNVDCMTEKRNILKASQVPVMHLLSLTTSRQPVTT